MTHSGQHTHFGRGGRVPAADLVGRDEKFGDVVDSHDAVGAVGTGRTVEDKTHRVQRPTGVFAVEGPLASS